MSRKPRVSLSGELLVKNEYGQEFANACDYRGDPADVRAYRKNERVLDVSANERYYGRDIFAGNAEVDCHKEEYAGDDEASSRYDTEKTGSEAVFDKTHQRNNGTRKSENVGEQAHERKFKVGESNG